MIHHSILSLGGGIDTPFVSFEKRISDFLREQDIYEEKIINIELANGYFTTTYHVYWRD